MSTSKAQQAEKEIRRPRAFKILKAYLKSLGPGLNGIATPPLLFMIMLIGSDRQTLRSKGKGPVSRVLTTVAMTAAAVALALSSRRDS